MKQLSKCFIALLLASISFCYIDASQTLSPAITVNGNPLVTTQLVTRLGDEWFLPLLPIAEAVGSEVRITTAEPRELIVRRADGTEVSYNNRTGELRSRVVLLGRVNGFEHIQIVDSRQDLLFPLSGVERTEREFRTLLGDAGFAVSSITPTASPVSVIDARPA